MTARSRIKTVLVLGLATTIVVQAVSTRAATMSSSATAPVVDGADIANYGPVTGTDKWWADAKVSGRPKGQTFTTGDRKLLLRALAYQVTSTQEAEPTKQYVIRVGTINRVNPSDSTTWIFTQIYSETATQDFFWAGGEYMTWTFNTPVLLAPNTEYGVDVGMTSSTSAWQTGIPYLNRTADEYVGGTRYMSGTGGIGIGETTMNNVGGDMIFHLDLVHPMSPSPDDGATVPVGDVVLSWMNLPPNVGSDVWADVWFGTDPGTDFARVVTAGLNTTSVTVSAPVADTYYWRVDSYLNGSPTGAPLEGTAFIFYVVDTDGDGLPDDFELAHTDPPSPTDLNAGDDLEPDGLTNLQEYEIGTDPTNADTDEDTLQDGPELAGAGLRPATDPLDADTDDDGLSDGVETNTGVYTNSSDTGTDPTAVDSDSDGLSDGVETNTEVFVDESDTGTDPTKPDSDDDDAGDWYEVVATYTDPTDPGDNPGIPYPLPDPDGSIGATDKPVKVYILSGQSNMVGMGNISGTQPGTLETIAKRENKFPNLVDDGGDWTVRNDVMYRGVITAIGQGPLTPGVQGGTIGPEMGFGHVMGYYHDEPVLIIKSSQGNRSTGWDFLPPGSERFTWTDGGTDWTYAGYGDSPGRWETGTTPAPINWYAGKQFDDCFMDENDWAPLGGDPVFNVTDVLDDFASEYPQYAAQGFEIAGFVWWQGHKDQGEPYASRYESNMVNFINKLRRYYENRYPDNINPNAPFVLATIAFGGWDLAGAGLTVANAQLAVSGETGNYPEFAGNVKTMEARGYWREVVESPTDQGHHYHRNAETYMLVGDALGRAMIELDAPYSVDAGPDMITWSGKPVELNATVQNGVIVVRYAWSANPNDGVVFNSKSIEDPMVTIAGTTDNPSSITLKLEVTDDLDQQVTDTVVIDVYDDACKAAIGKGLATDDSLDLDKDCVIGFGDFALMALTWLDDNSLRAPRPK